ncbi:MAG: acyl-CoA thioesterase domain-containing protein [Actinomycetota bacterium]
MGSPSSGESLDLAGLIELLGVSPTATGPTGRIGSEDGRGDPVDRFVGQSPADRDRQVYGGQFLAQALVAAAATVEPGRHPHSLHAYFLRTGTPRTPIDYHVERVRDGRTASHRSVTAVQGEREVFRQLMSFQVDRPGPIHPPLEPFGPSIDPEALPDYRDWVADLSDRDDHPWFAEDLPIDLRIQDPPPTGPRGPMPDRIDVWLRMTGSVPGQQAEDPVWSAALLAWMSDKTISDVVLYPHGRSWTDDGADILSLDHALWFHRPVPVDSWLRLTHHAVATSRGRGLARGDLFTLDGELVASVAQEAFIVLPDDT